MGQGQSTGAHPPPSASYHPSAVGFTVGKGKVYVGQHAKHPFAQHDLSIGTTADGTRDEGSHMRRGLIGPMRARVKGRKQTMAAGEVQVPSPRHPEWTTTLTAVPTNSPSVRDSVDYRPRASTLPTGLDTAHAARSAHVDTIFGGSPTRAEPTSPTENTGDAAVTAVSPAATTPSITSLASPAPSPRGEYRVSAAPSHPSIIELPENEAAESDADRRSSAETIRSASRITEADKANTLQVPGTAVLHSGEQSPDTVRLKHDKRASNSTDTSQEAPSLAPSTASGVARRAADEANHQTLLAYWETQRGKEGSDSLTPHRQMHRHSWASSRSGARSPGEPRNLSPYRQVAGRWTSHWEDRRGLGISQSSFNTAEEQPKRDDSPTDAQPPATEANASVLHGQVRAAEGDRLNSSPARSYRKPVPEHDVGIIPPSPVRQTVRLSDRFSGSDSDGLTSKRTSDQSHFSAATGALHQHVERLRAGPTYQIDENASHLFEPESTVPSVSATPAPAMQDSASPSPKRGRALSLSLMNRLKNRTRKNSDASLLAARIPSSSHIEAPSPAKSDFSSTLPTPRSPPIPLTPSRRGAELTDESSGTGGLTAKLAQPPRLYQIARKPGRKAAPTIAASDASVFSRASPTVQGASASQRNLSVNSRHSRPASIASRRSSRSMRSSNASLRAMNKAHSNTDSKGAPMKQTGSSIGSGTPWWNPWSRKNSAAGLPVKADEEDDGGWVDEPEDDRGIVSPVAEDAHLPTSKGPEKVQQPWAPAWSNRVLHTQDASENGKSSDERQDGLHRGHTMAATHGELKRESPPLAYIGPQTPAPITASSSFSSLAPPPAPAPVPPPRKNRRTRRTDSGSNQASSSSPNSPALPSNEEDNGGSNARFLGRDERASPSNTDEDQTTTGPSTALALPSMPNTDVTAPFVHSAGVTDLSRPVSSNTDARESLLSDDLDYVPPSSDAKTDADELDSVATLQTYRSSLVDSRRPRGGQHAYVNLSPVREIMTPESRIVSDDRSGARSAASTFDALSHRRVNSGASMRLVAMSPSEQMAERRPVPAPSVVAEPHTDLASVHRSNSISSSFGASTVGGQASVSSMKKHTGYPTDVAVAAAAATVVANRRLRLLEDSDKRLRASSMPSKPRSPLASSPQSASPPPDRHSFSPATGTRLNGQVRESWRSSDGPWDARVISLTDAVALPAARGVTRPTAGTVRRQRSTSVPLTTLANPTDVDAEDEDVSVVPPEIDEEPVQAAPFAETAMQASLAALQALERSEEAQSGDWRARWASEKLLGFSSTQPAPPSILRDTRRLSPNNDLQVPTDDYSDYSGARSRRRAEPYPRLRHEGSTSSMELKASLRRRARSKRQEITSSSASQIGGGGYDSSMAAGAFTSDSDAASRRNSRRRGDASRHRKVDKAKVSTIKSQTRAAESDVPSPAQRYATLPLASAQRHLTTAEWDETVVPAHAKRLEHEAAEEARLMTANYAPSGLVVPGSPSSAPASQILLQSPDRVVRPIHAAEVSMGSMMDYGSAIGAKPRSTHRTHKSTGKRRDGTNHREGSKSHDRRHRSGSGSKHLHPDRAAEATTGTHAKFPTSSTASLARSTRSGSTRKGYGCDDIMAWQASLQIAALPAVAET